MLRAGVIILGLIFVTKGFLGFNDDFIVIENGVSLLFETFAVNDIINWIHLLTGVAALVSALSDRTSKLFFQVFGVIYILLAVIGIFQGTTVLGLFQTNTETNLANFALGALMIILGFGVKINDQPQNNTKLKSPTV